MKLKSFDIIEVMLKKELKIPLSKEESEWLSQVDEETKESIKMIINESSYEDEIIRLMNHILEKSLTLPEEEQQYIKNRCCEKKKQLEKINF